MTTIDKQKEDGSNNELLEMAKAMSELQERAVAAYRPLVDDICSRKAKEDEVDHLLTWMFDFVENERMLMLFNPNKVLIQLLIIPVSFLHFNFALLKLQQRKPFVRCN